MQIRDYTIVSDLQKGEILLEEIIGIFRRAYKDAPYRKSDIQNVIRSSRSEKIP